MRWLLLLVLAACGAVGSDSSKCAGGCPSGFGCCLEPTHMVTDAGTAGSEWRCAQLSGSACPQQP